MIFNLPEGKVKYDDPRMARLVEKCSPKKVSPYYVEFLKDELAQCEAIVISRKSILDLLITDIEKCDPWNGPLSALKKRSRKNPLNSLRRNPLSATAHLQDTEREALRSMGMQNVKPVVVLDKDFGVTEVIESYMDKAGIVFLHRGPQGGPRMAGAGRFGHRDLRRPHPYRLARGFIKGDVAAFEDFMQCHNWNDCQRKGLVKVVERDYKIAPGDIIKEIRFNV